MTELLIDPESYRCNQTHHRLAEQVMSTHGLDENDVTTINLTERDAEVWSLPKGCRRRLVVLYGPSDCDVSIVRVHRRYPHPGRTPA